MAERPDLEYFVPILDRALTGARIVGAIVKKPVVLRMMVHGDLDSVVAGSTITSVTRRGHFVLFSLEHESQDFQIAVSPMLAGRFTIAKATERAPKDLAITMVLNDEQELRYRDDVQMGKVYVFPRGKFDLVPSLATIGLDALDPKVFTRKAFHALAKSRRDQLKVFLMDKAAIDSMGNAYADEALFEAGLHPKTFVRSLDDEAIERLRESIVKVLDHACRELVSRQPPIDVKLRDFLKVRNRPGLPCTRCGTKIRKAGVHGHDAFFCPNCQPETRSTSIVDWRKL